MLNVRIYDNGDGGSIETKNNNQLTTRAIWQIVYFKLFGGNVQQSTNRKINKGVINYSWWGNNKNDNPDNWINSETEKTLRIIVTNESGRNQLIKAVKKDLRTLDVYGEIEVEVYFKNLNRVEIIITISQIQGNSKYSITWDATKNEVVNQITL